MAAPASDSTLSLKVGRATLTLDDGDSCLLITDESTADGKQWQEGKPRKRNSQLRSLCGLRSIGHSSSSSSIPLYNVLWAQVWEQELSIAYARVKGAAKKELVVSATRTFALDHSELEAAQDFARRLLERAYGQAKTKKRVLVLVNPFSGQGRARRYLSELAVPLFKAARLHYDIVETQYRHHATEIARDLDLDKYDAVICCSGDGIPHEVYNGLGKRPDAKKALARMPVCQLPGGTGCSMSINCNGTKSTSLAALAIIKGGPVAVDLMSVTQGDQRTLSFLCMYVGIICEADLGTENMRWMGSIRMTLGYMIRCLGKKTYPCEIAYRGSVTDQQALRDIYHASKDAADAAYAAGPVNPETDADSTSDQDAAGVSTADKNGLPPLVYGTVHDDLTADWEQLSYDKLSMCWGSKMNELDVKKYFFPTAAANDGYIDLFCTTTAVHRLTMLMMVDKFASPENSLTNPHLEYRKVKAFRVTPRQKEGVFAIDGEAFPYDPYQVEVSPGLGRTLCKSGKGFEPPGVA